MPAQQELGVGAKAPNFTIPDAEGRKVSLSDFLGKKVVLYFYVRDDTPGCTRESCDLRDSIKQIEQKGALVLGISPDSVGSHKKFASKYSLPFHLLSDEGTKVAKLYGVWKLKNLYGREYWGNERSTFVIDENGRIKNVFRKVKVDGHLQEVLSAL